MHFRRLLTVVGTVVALSLTVWTIGAAVNLDAIMFSKTDGDIVAAADFQTAFATVNDNFTTLATAVNANRSGGAQTLSNTCIGAGDSTSTIAMVTITPPADGFAIVEASGKFDIPHGTGADTAVLYGLSDDGVSYAPAQALNVFLEDTLPNGVYQFPMSTHQMFSVTAGLESSFYLLAERVFGSASLPGLCSVTLTALFVPEAFGALSTSSASQAPSSAR